MTQMNILKKVKKISPDHPDVGNTVRMSFKKHECIETSTKYLDPDKRLQEFIEQNELIKPIWDEIRTLYHAERG